jgi:TRAP-type C4-dicarboxylate transport system permease small subunit
MERIADLYCRALVALMALALLLMVLLVFGNVVLRYGFNSSITVSEELGRWLFVWITFMGAVVALRERSHLGTDVLVSRLSPRGKKICLVLGHLTMLYICWLVFKGSLEQTRINWDVLAPTTQWSMAAVHSAGVAFSISGALMLLLDLWLLLRGRVADEQLLMIQESEDLAALNRKADHRSPR